MHLLALPAAVLAILRWRHAGATRNQRLFLYWVVAALAVFALQLLPIPASLFARMPQRAAVLADLHHAGLTPGWLPMTLDTWGSVRALLAFATFAAMALLAMTLSQAARQRLLMLALLAAVPMALLGYSQAAAGANSTLRFYDYHHPMGAIGLFANRNHYADLMGLLLPFGFAFAAQAQSRQQRGLAAAWYALVVILLLAAALSFSRAGIALTVVAVAASVLLLRPVGTRGRHVLPLLALGLAALGIATYAWDGIVARLAQDPLDDLRWQYVHYGMDAMRAWLPWGSGFGSFRDVYATFEPVSAMVEVFALHAHNDLLEVAIEAGAPGLALIGAFLVLLFIASFSKFRKVLHGRAENSRTIHAAAAVACMVPILHSLVDYPLRTLAIATVFALALSVLLAGNIEQPQRRLTA
ncbi:O-antigen ligase family protein [Cognatiluteimonas profundi]|uniref:O-antigen ligase family protein n=1 Tax=Cognatiluteimonas profundi TaxID=2594501 RepID=UPI00131E3A67|nr:O-antigen ligase family protein [Lysobacter profundi]